MLKSWKTSVIGFVGGAGLYLLKTGATLPSNRNELFNFLLCVVIAGLGLAAKDSNVTHAQHVVEAKETNK